MKQKYSLNNQNNNVKKYYDARYKTAVNYISLVKIILFNIR